MLVLRNHVHVSCSCCALLFSHLLSSVSEWLAARVRALHMLGADRGILYEKSYSLQIGCRVSMENRHRTSSTLLRESLS